MKLSRRKFVAATAGAAVGSWITPWGAARAAEPYEEKLQEARQRIQQHRKGDGLLVVETAQGKPVAGARFKIQQLRHQFLFGCNLFRWGKVNDPDRENQYRERFSALLNYATLGFYWGGYESRRGQPDYDYTDQVLAWCRQKDIQCKGHPLAWDHPASSPKWLPQDLSELNELSQGRVQDIVQRFKGRIDMWDVVNEPTDLTRFKNPMNNLITHTGAVAFTRAHLEVARNAHPGAMLLVNDYRADAAYRKILDQLRDQGEPLFDGVGIQSHMHEGGWPLGRLEEICDAFARYQRPIHFTETTVVSGSRKPDRSWDRTTAEGEKIQADYVPAFYTMLFAQPAVEAVTWWDFSDDGAWQGAPAGWLRRDMSPKPVYERLQDLIKREWWTELDGETNERGEARCRGFFGHHRIRITSPHHEPVEQEVDWYRGQPNRWVVSLT